MTLVRKIKDKKVNFEFNKEYIKVVTDKISNNDAIFILRIVLSEFCINSALLIYKEFYDFSKKNKR